ncbi:S8 family serine peptidase [Paenibacillus sp. VCA1]|uniref:S8 family serine peptidase n=1 Tax=Paenibacillus sp. VCA1 TaxID=3039148 RepID=UPI002871496F|nr:S8 family serine peptidase [Paenibacillus sp. VCA1]MDR9857186.1 S8 family serine peptidase [Paenibacillus sp. VCA1]
MSIHFPDPTWARLAFPEPPDYFTSGQNIGIVIIDKLKPHETIKHLGSRLKYVTVNDDLSIISKNIAHVLPSDCDGDRGEHGLMTLLALSHKPFRLQGKSHVGIAPAANFIVLDHGAFREGEGDRLKKGIDWILANMNDWNIRIILNMGWHAQDHLALLKNTDENSTVQALHSAVEKGILVICSNGNTRLINILPPVSFLAVGGYNDRGSQNVALHVPYPDEPYGRNGDGHFRPDVLAPRVRLTIPYCETKDQSEEVTYFWGTSGAAALVAGVAGYLFSKYPHLDSTTLRNFLTEHGDPLLGYDNPAPRINVTKVIHAIRKGLQPKGIKEHQSSSQINESYIAIHSADDIERGLALSNLIQRQLCSRDHLLQFALDESAVVRKIAVSSLYKPLNIDERMVFWNRLFVEKEGGVRGWYAYGLLQDAGKEEAAKWIRLSTDTNWTVRWCVSEYLAKFPDCFPQLEKTHDPDFIEAKALPVKQWLANEHRGI